MANTVQQILTYGYTWQLKNKKTPFEYYGGYYWYDEQYYNDDIPALICHPAGNLPTNIFEKMKGHKPFYISPNYKFNEEKPEFYKEYASLVEAETALAIALDELGIKI